MLHRVFVLLAALAGAAPLAAQVTIDFEMPGSPCAFSQVAAGGYRFDMNAFAAGHGGGNPHPDLQRPGTYVHCQIWSRDPGYAPPNASALTSALQYVIGP